MPAARKTTTTESDTTVQPTLRSRRTRRHPPRTRRGHNLGAEPEQVGRVGTNLTTYRHAD
ncbi:hypothetical protein ACIQGT_25815 [Streptomyces sp. NPDC093108]|uniref:hypothetical protein n=1 Tax=Streptomyces sp. NPDC093108 TaxID=3366030 RepID=UPI0037F19848